MKTETAIRTVVDFVRSNPDIEAISSNPQHQRNQVLAEFVCVYLEYHYRLSNPSEVPVIDNMVLAEQSQRMITLLESAYQLQQQTI